MAPSNREQVLLELFLADHADGDLASFDQWAAGNAELDGDPDVRERVRSILEQRPCRRELSASTQPGVMDSASFFRLARHRGSEEAQAANGPTPLHAGKRVGHFTLLEFIARGGQGQVWEARDENLRRNVALKLVLPERIDPRKMERFAREARAGGRLHHPNIVMTLGYGHDEGLAWIAQELVEGSWTLKDLIHRLRSLDTLPKGYYRQVAQLIAKVADGLEAAHDAGVIHRDVKPQNVLLLADDTPKLTDFGLARVTDDSFLSQTGDFAGTWAYMSPEQITAKRMGLDHRTDVFSLGVVLYELLALRRPSRATPAIRSPNRSSRSTRLSHRGFVRSVRGTSPSSAPRPWRRAPDGATRRWPACPKTFAGT